MITQRIDTLTEVVPYTPNYFEDIALRNNALVTDIFPQFNTAIGQINSELSVMNGYVTSTSTAAANALAYANNAAIAAAAATAAANRAEAVVIPTNAAYATTVDDYMNACPDKATFNALAAERRANRAGSGFDEFGKHYTPTATILPVNEGIWTEPTIPNEFRLGRWNSTFSGTSKTEAPSSSINGISHKIEWLNSTDSDNRCKIILPPAPTVLPYDATLTQQQIDSGVIKHADASNSGLITNGRNLTLTTGWLNGAGSHSVSSGKLQITNGTSVEGYDSQSFTTVIGKKYTIEIVNTDGTSLSNTIKVGNSIGASTLVNLSNVASGTRSEVEFTATATLTYVTLGTGTTTTGETALFGDIAVFPADSKSRSDLAFLEVWHEKISDKGVVYRYGNTQFKGSSESAFGTQVTPSAGTPIFAGYGTYSLFSDTWQADEALIGNCYVWANMTDAQKKAFVSDPENNVYRDGADLIQVRYRMRVVQGWGDTWENNASTSGVTRLAYTSTNSRVKPKGKMLQLASGDLATFSSERNSWYISYDHTETKADLQTVIGAFQTTVGSTSPDTVAAYDGKCFALPIALVHRRNQGMMHPVYNPNGTKLASDDLPWYSTTVSFTSIADCFTDSKLLATSGYINTTTGRADGIFYDQIHEGDITDLRMSSKIPTDYNRLIDKEFNRLVAGTYRGSEGEWNVLRVASLDTDGTSSTNLYFTAPYSVAMMCNIGDMINFAVIRANGSIVWYTKRVDFVGPNYIQFDSATVRGSGGYLFSIKSTRTKSNTLTHTDIIGSPANYPNTWKTSGVSGVPLIVAEDGTSMLPTGALTTFKLSRKANATPLQVLKSTDSGVTWTALTVTTHYTFSTNTNVITFVTAPAATDLVRVTYQTHTNMAIAAVNSEVLAIGDALLNAYSGFSASIYSLIGKVGTVDFANNGMGSSKLISVGVGTTLNIDPNVKPSHSPLAPIVATSPTVKAFPYLTRSNGKAYLQLVFKEMKYGSYAAPTVVTEASATYTQNMTYKINVPGCALDGKVIQWTTTTTTGTTAWSLYDVSPTGVIYLLSSGVATTAFRLYDGDSWGDDSKFNIVDNVSTTTDTNGATVLIGQKRCELPFFIGASE